MTGLRRASWLLGLSIVLFSGCGEDGPTQVPGPASIPPVPSDLQADLGERDVSLRWEVSSTEGIDFFRVYRKEGAAESFTLHGIEEATSYADSNLVPGRAYTYTVSSVGTSGVESDRSEELTVTPGSFGLIIDDRAEFTSSRTVTLSFTAPEGTGAVRIGNDSLLSGSFFEAFDGTRTWLLPDQDGLHTVYARFRSTEGVESPLVRAQITLDRRAEILSLTESSGGEVLLPGDTLRIEMKTGESGGTATVTLGAALASAPLAYESSTNAYRLELVVTPDLSVREEVVVGSFVDRAGNAAAPRATTSTVTIANAGSPPAAVQLLAPAETGTDWIALSWTASEDVDFERYSVYRSQKPGVQGGAGEVVIGVITDVSETGLVDSLLLRDSTTYYYRVFVEDHSGFSTGSNVISATTRNAAPAAVVSFDAASVDSPSTAVRLTWSAVDPSTVHDFAAYEIYRSTSEAVSAQSERIGTVGDISTRSFVDNGTDQATSYAYRIYVVDRGGLATGSEPATATTTDLDPSFVSLGSPAVDQANENVTLSWSPNTDPDFASYRIYWSYGTDPEDLGDFALLDVINNAAVLTYAHDANVPSTPFYAEYYLDVEDRAGRITRSNQVRAVFSAPEAPAIAGLAETIDTTFAIISFETDVPTTATLSYGTNPGSLSSTTQDGVFRTTHSLVLSPLQAARSYYYRLTVTNERGDTTTSTIGSFTTLGGT